MIWSCVLDQNIMVESMWNTWYSELDVSVCAWQCARPLAPIPKRNEWKILRRRNNNFNWTNVFVEWTHLRSLYFFFSCLIFYSHFFVFLLFLVFCYFFQHYSPLPELRCVVSLLLVLLLLLLFTLVSCCYCKYLVIFVYILFNGGKLCVHRCFSAQISYVNRDRLL